MIKNNDRSGWIGASDTSKVVGNWRTASWQKWWAEKLGIAKNHFTTPAMAAGTAYEHRILDALGIKKRDRQVKIRKYRLRVNLDGEDKTHIHEIKTHMKTPFKLPQAYWQQAQVEMFVTGKKLYIDAYQMTEEEYKNYFLPIDLSRHDRVEILYDEKWIEETYLPRLKILADCLRKGIYPCESGEA